MPETPEPEGSSRPVRYVDARSLRGLAHPLRVRMLELLKLDGPATSTQLADRLGENTGTVSWHLRNLAEHGFIEEETGRGTKRERWWRVVPETQVLNTTQFRDNPDTNSALSVYLHQLVQGYYDRMTRYITEDWPARWRDVGTFSEWTHLRLNPAQLDALNQELAEVVARHTPAPDAPPDSDALPVTVQLQSFPRRERGEA